MCRAKASSFGANVRISPTEGVPARNENHPHEWGPRWGSVPAASRNGRRVLKGGRLNPGRGLFGEEGEATPIATLEASPEKREATLASQYRRRPSAPSKNLQNGAAASSR